MVDLLRGGLVLFGVVGAHFDLLVTGGRRRASWSGGLRVRVGPRWSFELRRTLGTQQEQSFGENGKLRTKK